MTYYFYDVGGKPRKEIPLGSDFIMAVRKWADIEATDKPFQAQFTFGEAADRYLAEVIPTKAIRSQSDNIKELANLREFFAKAPLEEINPVHIRQYMSWRADKARAYYISKKWEVPPKVGHVRANREIALFSHIFNWCRELGYTNAPNPCQGTRRNPEDGRDVYVEDDTFARVYAVADQPTRDALDLAYLTGQRPADTLGFDERDIRDGAISVGVDGGGQRKTGMKLRIQVVGELAVVIERIRARKRTCKIVSTKLVVNEHGQALTAYALRGRFTKARKAAGVQNDLFQIRDLRAKAGTDKTESSGDIRQAQKQLGHTSVTMTETYVRNRKGDKVGPTR